MSALRLAIMPILQSTVTSHLISLSLMTKYMSKSLALALSLSLSLSLSNDEMSDSYYHIQLCLTMILARLEKKVC